MGAWELLEILGGWPFVLAPTTLVGLACNGGLGTNQHCRWHYTTSQNQHCYTMDLLNNLSREHMTHQVLALVPALVPALVLALVPALVLALVLALAQVLVLALVLVLAQVLALALVLVLGI